MACKMIKVAEGFWNIRGSFKIGGLIDIGTQCSLVKMASGAFVFLDAYDLSDDVAEQVAALTGNGAQIEAIINLHPFHTVHVAALHQRYPDAKLYGTQRHVDYLPELPWQPLLCESAQLHQQFADDLEFSVPAGVDFISANPKLHFASVLAFHRPSATIHVDDTLVNMRLPLPMRLLGQRYAVTFHPTLGKTLQARSGAADEFRDWARHLAQRWRTAENLCAAHTSALLAPDNNGPSIADRITLALQKTERVLAAHQRKFE